MTLLIVAECEKSTELNLKSFHHLLVLRFRQSLTPLLQLLPGKQGMWSHNSAHFHLQSDLTSDIADAHLGPEATMMVCINALSIHRQVTI